MSIVIFKPADVVVDVRDGNPPVDQSAESRMATMHDEIPGSRIWNLRSQISDLRSQISDLRSVI